MHINYTNKPEGWKMKEWGKIYVDKPGHYEFDAPSNRWIYKGDKNEGEDKRIL
ncbi:MAG: hypothetical protein ACE5J7_00575 [Candidatus Aenigmatarchaeota archaeon]